MRAINNYYDALIETRFCESDRARARSDWEKAGNDPMSNDPTNTTALTTTLLGDLPVDLSTLHADAPAGAAGGDACPGLAFYYGIQAKERTEEWCLTHNQQSRWLEPGTIIATIASRRVVRETVESVDEKGQKKRTSTYAYEAVPNMPGATAGKFAELIGQADDKEKINAGVSFLSLVWFPNDLVNPAAICAAEAFKTICKSVYSSFDRRLKDAQGARFSVTAWRSALTQNKAGTGSYIDPKKARAFLEPVTLNQQQLAAASKFVAAEPVKAAVNAWLRR